MISYSYLIPLIFLVMLVILTILFVTIGKLTYSITEKLNFSFRNHFPFELFYQKNIRVVSYFRLILIIYFAFLVAINIMFATTFRGGSNIAFATITSLFFIFSLLVDLILFFLRPNYLKQFKIYSTLAFAFSLMANGMLGVLLLTSLYEHFAYKILASIALVIFAFNAALMLNPKLKNWDHLEESKNIDGTITFVRPKISPLAFSLWLNFVSVIVGETLMLISMLLTSLEF